VHRLPQYRRYYLTATRRTHFLTHRECRTAHDAVRGSAPNSGVPGGRHSLENAVHDLCRRGGLHCYLCGDHRLHASCAPGVEPGHSSRADTCTGPAVSHHVMPDCASDRGPRPHSYLDTGAWTGLAHNGGPRIGRGPSQSRGSC
jgi:hypothetical protein